MSVADPEFLTNLLRGDDGEIAAPILAALIGGLCREVVRLEEALTAMTAATRTVAAGVGGMLGIELDLEHADPGEAEIMRGMHRAGRRLLAGVR